MKVTHAEVTEARLLVITPEKVISVWLDEPQGKRADYRDAARILRARRGKDSL